MWLPWTYFISFHFISLSLNIRKHCNLSHMRLNVMLVFVSCQFKVSDLNLIILVNLELFHFTPKADRRVRDAEPTESVR